MVERDSPLPVPPSPDYSSFVDQMSRDPTSSRDWPEEDCRNFLCWILRESDLDKPKYPDVTRQDIYLLHCLLTTEAFHIDELLRPLNDGVIETALSLAVTKNDNVLIKYLLKMGASADVLIGPVSSAFNKPSMYASDRPCPTFFPLLIQYGQAPARTPTKSDEEMQEIEDTHPDHQAFLQAIQTNNIVQFFDKGVEYDMAQLIQDPNIVKSWTRTHRAYVYARLNQRRPNGPSPREFTQIDIFYSYQGHPCHQISVNSYLIDEFIERKNALHEAVARKNLPHLVWLLEEKQADPNQASYVGGLLFDNVMIQCSPIEQTLRGFLVWDDDDSLLVGRMMELLLDNGSTHQDQRTALIRILRDNISLHMVCMEMLHFMHMTKRLLDRTPDVLTEELSHEFNAGFPLMLRSCEKKWFEEAIELSTVVQCMDRVLAEVPAFLTRVTPPQRFSLRPDTFRVLTIHRCYRTLATLFKTYGGRLSSIDPLCLMINVVPPNMEPIYNDAHRAIGFPVDQVTSNHNRRVQALLLILARLYPVTQQVRDFLLQYLRVLTGDHNVILPKSIDKLQNRAVSVLKQQVMAKRMTDSYIASRLPPTLYHDVYQSNVEFLTLTIFDPAA